MTNLELFEKALERSGLKLTFIIDKLGITRQAFSNKRKGLSDFTIEEMVILSKLFNLSNAEREKIFFAQNGEE